jgi:hypothetical protein
MTRHWAEADREAADDREADEAALRAENERLRAENERLRRYGDSMRQVCSAQAKEIERLDPTRPRAELPN